MADTIRDMQDARPSHGPIPGERDPTNLTHREPAAIGGEFAGADIPPVAPPWLDETIANDHIREGGGKPRRT